MQRLFRQAVAESDDQGAYRLLTRNMVLTVVIISLVPLLITGSVLLYQFAGAYRGKVAEHLQELVEKHSRDVDTFLNDRLANIRVMARNNSIDRLRDTAFLREHLTLLREEYAGAFVDVGLVDASGTQVAYAGPFNLQMADYSQAKWFHQALKSEHFISDVFTGLRGSPHFIVAVKRNCGQSCYILKATIDFEAFNALVESIRLGSTGFAFIVNRQGSFQTKPGFDVPMSRGPYAEILGREVRAKRPLITERADAFGRESFFALAPLKAGEWVMILQQQTEDALSTLYTTVTIAVVIFVISGVIVAVVSFLMSQRLVGRLARSDHERAVMTDKVIEAGRLASIGELAAGIAHEINNPVAIMVEEAGWIDDLLGDEDACSEANLAEIQRAVGQIRTQGGRCKAITHKLLSFARKTDPTHTLLSVNELVGELFGLIQQKTRYANVKVAAELDQDLPAVEASSTELQQVLLNLVNNAVDAMEPQGGTVTVSTARDEQGRVAIKVADTGRGISEANLDRIFDPFYTTKPVGQGTGLGLSIVYGIVKKLGGDIGVTSQKGQGATFTIYLPAASAASARSGTETQGSTGTQAASGGAQTGGTENG